MYTPKLLQALHEAAMDLPKAQWSRVIYLISTQLAEATREIWRLYGTRLRETDPAEAALSQAPQALELDPD